MGYYILCSSESACQITEKITGELSNLKMRKNKIKGKN